MQKKGYVPIKLFLQELPLKPFQKILFVPLKLYFTQNINIVIHLTKFFDSIIY